MTHDEALAFFDRRQEHYRRRDPEALAADYTLDGVVHSPLFPDVAGRDAIEATYARLFSVFPDWELTFDAPIIDGDRAAQPFVVGATHVGEFMGLPGTGRRVQIHGALICTLRDGLIAEERRVYDFTGLLIQLGVLRSKTALKS
jgi:predicted ester cyclase